MNGRSHFESTLINQIERSDKMFFIAHLYNSACSYAANPIRIHPIFMSIIFHHYKQLIKLSEQIEEKEENNKSITEG